MFQIIFWEILHVPIFSTKYFTLLQLFLNCFWTRKCLKGLPVFTILPSFYMCYIHVLTIFANLPTLICARPVKLYNSDCFSIPFYSFFLLNILSLSTLKGTDHLPDPTIHLSSHLNSLGRNGELWFCLHVNPRITFKGIKYQISTVLFLIGTPLSSVSWNRYVPFNRFMALF